MVSNPIDIKYVFKRERYLEKRKAVNESAKLPDISDSRGKLYAQKIETFFNECTSAIDAIPVLETLYRDNRFDLLESSVQKIINEIIPLTENSNLNGCIDAINDSNIGDVNKDRIVEEAKRYKTIDRIIKNHGIISKRFEMGNLRGKSDRDKCFAVCEMVDTYRQPVMTKFNIVLEEMKYLNFMDGTQMSDKEMVKNVTDYFLMSESYNGNRYDFGNAVKNSKAIDNNAGDLIPYLIENCNDTAIGIDKFINSWKVNPKKSIDSLVEMVRNNYSSVTVLDKLIDTINEYTSINNIEFDPIHIFDEISSVNAEEATNISKLIRENHISDSDDLLFNLKTIWEAEENDSSYDDTVVFDNNETIPVEKVGPIRMNNIITDSQAAGEFLDHLEKTAAKESPVTIKKILSKHSDMNLDESNIINHVDANGHLNMKIRSYMVEGNIEDVMSLIHGAVNCINNSMYGRDCKAYYTIDENGFDIGIRSKYTVSLTESQIQNKGFSDTDIGAILAIESCTKSLEEIEKSPLLNIINKMDTDKDYAATVPMAEVALINEMINPFIDGQDSIIESFIESCDDEVNPQYYMMKDACSHINEETFNPYINTNIDRIDLCAAMMGIQEAVNFPIKSFNDVKLAWNGVKSKMKNASAKEQEMCRDMDIEFNHMLKSIKSMGPDHREEIITGEVNHSLSKAIKIGIALAGVGAAAGSAMVPILGALSIFIRSKHLTTKEKKMILDEIDIELQVLEREIGRAEQSGSTKKYRQLLTIQKNLQRKRQELYYGLVKKGKRIPMQATAGMRNRE